MSSKLFSDIGNLGWKIYQHPNEAASKALLTLFRRCSKCSVWKIHQKEACDRKRINWLPLPIIENFHTDQNLIAENIGISQVGAWQILKEYSYHSCKIQLHQELFENDYRKRLWFCMSIFGRSCSCSKLFQLSSVQWWVHLP